MQFQWAKISISILMLFAFWGISTAQTDSLLTNQKKDKPPKSFLDNDRKWAIEIPIWVPGFAGEFSYGDVSIEGEDGSDPGTPENPIEPPEPGEPPIGGGNIISRLFTSSSYLKFFFMNRVTYRPGKFVFQFDAFAGAVGEDVKFKLNDKTVVNAEFRSILFRAFAGYAFLEGYSRSKKSRYILNAYVGARFHIFHVETQLSSTRFAFDIDPYWAEPIIGLQGNFALKNWAFQLQGDWGGFYINDKNSYMINGNVSYHISRLIGIKLGYNDWRIQHRGTLRREILYLKVHLSGPNLGITFYF